MVDMDDAAERLCTYVGMVMEDASVIALLPGEGGTFEMRLNALEQAGRDVAVLVEAVKVISRRWPAPNHES